VRPRAWHGFLDDMVGNNILNGLKTSYMNEQKNKQPQSQQDNQDKNMNKQGKQQGQKSNNQQDQDKQRMKSHIENPDQPDKKTEISDDPGETKKKIPNMHDKH
jgi:hypothetical protein